MAYDQPEDLGGIQIVSVEIEAGEMINTITKLSIMQRKFYPGKKQVWRISMKCEKGKSEGDQTLLKWWSRCFSTDRT